MPDSDTGRRARAEQELAKASRALDRDDIAHAAVHVAQAITADPTFADAYEQLERVHTRAAEPDELFSLTGDEVYIGNLAARAHLAARAGDPDTALDWLMHAAAVEPSVPWLSGGAMASPRVRAGLDAQHVGSVLRLLARKLGTPTDQGRPAGLSAFLDLARATADAHPADIELAVRLALFAWAVGADPLAAAWCERAEGRTPGPLGAIMLGLALRDAGRPAEMEAAWNRAIRADPDNLDVYVDLAVALITGDRRRDGEAWLDRALARDPGHDRSVALRHALDYLDSGDTGHLIALVDDARAGGYADRASSALTLGCDTRLWLNRVPMPTEAIVSVANHVQAERTAGKKISMRQMAVTAIEPASAVAAARAVLPDLRVEVMACPAPDLRRPVAEVTYQIWRYEGGTRAAPVVPAASASAVEVLHEVANLPWAHPVAAHFGAARFAEVPLDELLGMLCHMPPPPLNDRWIRLGERTPTYWPRLAQAWICVGILHHSAGEPWAVSTRRRVLVDLVNGVEDWTTDAALFALVVAAWVDPSCRPDVAAVVRGRFVLARATAQRRVMTIASSIAELVLVTPGATRQDKARAGRLIRWDAHPARHRAQSLWRDIQFRLGR